MGLRRIDRRKCLPIRGNLDYSKVQALKIEGTFLAKDTLWSAGLSVSGDGVGIVAPTGQCCVTHAVRQTRFNH